MNYPGKTDPSIIGGVKLGTWFVHDGFAGYSGFPDWMKYFGFYTDFSYQSLEMPTQRLTGFNFFNPGASEVAGNPQLSGHATTWASMFAGRYGFFPDSEVPFGRLQPYVAVGPAVMFTSMDPKLQANGLSLAPGAIRRPLSPCRWSPGLATWHEERFHRPLLQISLCPAQLLF